MPSAATHDDFIVAARELAQCGPAPDVSSEFCVVPIPQFGCRKASGEEVLDEANHELDSVRIREVVWLREGPPCPELEGVAYGRLNETLGVAGHGKP